MHILHLLEPTTPLTSIFDSETLYHVTADLNNLLLHTHYAESDNIMIRDDLNLYIIFTDSLTIFFYTYTFNLYNIFYVPDIKINFISIY